MHIEKAKNENSCLIPVLQSNDNEYFLHSKYAPIIEGENLFNAINKQTKSLIVIVFGIGAGYHLSSLHLSKEDLLVLVEDETTSDLISSDKYLAPVKQSILDKLSNQTNLLIWKKSTHKNILKKLYIRVTKIPDFTPLLFNINLPGYLRFNKNFCHTLYTTINSHIQMTITDLAVIKKFSHQWKSHLKSNKKNIKQMVIGIPDFKTNKIIITGAGSTLLSHIVTINKLKKDGYKLLATDSSIPILKASNILPDFVLTIDAQPHSLKHYKNLTKEDKCNIILIKDIFTSPSLDKDFFQVQIVLAQIPLTEELGNHGNENFNLFYQTGGNVTFSALNICQKAGIENIILMGADFSFANKLPYCIETAYYQLYIQTQNKLKSLEQNIFQSIQNKTQLKQLNNYKQSILAHYGDDLIVNKSDQGYWKFKFQNTTLPITHHHLTIENQCKIQKVLLDYKLT